jgi:hypothetical protein
MKSLDTTSQVHTHTCSEELFALHNIKQGSGSRKTHCSLAGSCTSEDNNHWLRKAAYEPDEVHCLARLYLPAPFLGSEILF